MVMSPSLLVERREDDKNQLCPPIMLASGMLVYICCSEEDVALGNSARKVSRSTAQHVYSLDGARKYVINETVLRSAHLSSDTIDREDSLLNGKN